MILTAGCASIEDYFERWKSLRALRCRHWPDVVLKIRQQRAPTADFSTGHAWIAEDGSEKEIVLRPGWWWPDTLTTLLHEMSHIKAWGKNEPWRRHHGLAWRVAFETAALEILGTKEKADLTAGGWKGLHLAVREMFVKRS